MINTTLRINEDLYNKVVKASLNEKRSINSQLIYIIETYFKIIKNL